MPPRIASASVAPSTSALLQISAGARVMRAPAQQQACAGFSTTASRAYNPKARRAFWKWLSGPGNAYRKAPAESKTLYLGKNRNPFRPEGKDEGAIGSKVPFPLNPNFRSTPILSNQSRELIWNKVMRKGETIKAVSAELGVDITRVAAVVRLKEVEKDWIAKGIKLAWPYARAIRHMLPVKSYNPEVLNKPLEDINELHVHPHTMKQLYWPTSESRQFTREDAAKAFHRNMLSADKRVPHPELIRMERDLFKGVNPSKAKKNFLRAVELSESKAAQAKIRIAQAEEQDTTRINTKRFEFRFKEINSEDVGPDGRKITAVGARYGRPSYDRVKGAVKIPTSVP
ncbi:uncharacterized protein JN550_004915 [Neoarthrinium moseri]|uniref:uncharacterized protein n=1 Tax=Neoarthrinium moseri TaxID=1658444 RepID=UPI001FDBA9F1|nr:uncharacterized protein JN550_004915 [Neoarthrinium moseri]KAI1870769.1 hypothetical protein JN550_004915 [Neoarthrinium moseri]